nr:MAG TPA: hypothetical protein [Bacteriophage sp.]
MKCLGFTQASVVPSSQRRDHISKNMLIKY